jgi:ATP-dependent Clp protease ATP-binding subunit ClpA
VVLFDEIEKAHPDVLNVLLQILDDGRITDAHGKTVNFENAVIVMTTNAGSDKSANHVGFETGDSVSADDAKTEKALSGFLRPEFLNRVDEVITFRSLDTEDFARIAAIMLSQLSEVLEERGIHLHFNKASQQLIAEKSYSHKFGARSMRRYIQIHVEDKLAEEIISRYGETITQVSLTVKKGELCLACM